MNDLSLFLHPKAIWNLYSIPKRRNLHFGGKCKIMFFHHIKIFTPYFTFAFENHRLIKTISRFATSRNSRPYIYLWQIIREKKNPTPRACRRKLEKPWIPPTRLRTYFIISALVRVCYRHKPRALLIASSMTPALGKTARSGRPSRSLLRRKLH